MKFLVFGDSFVKMFLHCPNVKYYKFKGKSIKGLVKEQDSERNKIQNVVRKTPNQSILFFFGQVDFNFVRYYKALRNEKQIQEIVFEQYVKWVSSLSKKSVIISIFPTPISKENVIRSLLSKGTYAHEEVSPQNDAIIYQEYQRTNQIWNKWNTWIQKYAAKYKVKLVKLFPNNYLQPQFKDVSSITPHLRYVPVLRLVQKHFGIEFNEEEAIKVERDYEADKEERVKNSKIREKEREEESLKNENDETDENQLSTKRLHAKSEDHINVTGKIDELEEKDVKTLSQGSCENVVKEEKKQISTSHQSKEESISSGQWKVTNPTPTKGNDKMEIVIGKNRQKIQKTVEIRKGKKKEEGKWNKIVRKQEKPKFIEKKVQCSDSADSDVDAGQLLQYVCKKK